MPWNLADIITRLTNSEKVYGFELELLASHIAEQTD